MTRPAGMIWAGRAAVLGAVMALALTLPFASAYFAAYPGFDVPPFWVAPLRGVVRFRRDHLAGPAEAARI